MIIDQKSLMLLLQLHYQRQQWLQSTGGAQENLVVSLTAIKNQLISIFNAAKVSNDESLFIISRYFIDVKNQLTDFPK